MATKEEFEKALRSAEFLSKEYPGDARILTRWGILLVGCKLESAGGYGSIKLRYGIEKLEAAIGIDPNRDDAFMWLGRSYITKGLESHDPEEANRCFDKADEYCRKAYAQQPENWEYKLYLEDPSRAHATHFGMFGSSSADAAHDEIESSSSTGSEPSSPSPTKRKEKQ